MVLWSYCETGTLILFAIIDRQCVLMDLRKAHHLQPKIEVKYSEFFVVVIQRLLYFL